MAAIFYDLETTDTNPIGQILNYCFLHVDDDLKVQNELVGEIKVSRLQLPSPRAMLANRTPILQHQARARLSERSAMLEIFEFIRAALPADGSKLALAGYNSNKFDLLHLRTSLIRNGFNPYFGGKVTYRDLLLAVRKLSCTRADFPRLPAVSSQDSKKLSLSLESITTRLGLLDAPQTHHSRDDVLLTIELARALRSRFALDVLRWNPYEASEWHRDGARKSAPPRVVQALHPNYDLSDGTLSTVNPMTLLDANPRYALWIDLKRYREGAGRRCISWMNPAIHHFFLESAAPAAEWTECAAAALREFSGIRLNNFFETSVCDIEQDIYRVDFDGIECLRQAIWEGRHEELNRLDKKDLKVLLLRYKLAHYGWGGGQDARFEDLLRKYALYRYGGACNIAKHNNSEEYKPGVYSENFHATMNELLEDLEACLTSATTEDERTILHELRTFYLSSDIYRVAGEELSKISRVRQEAAAEAAVEAA